MLINGFIDLKEKVDTIIGNFYIGRFSKNSFMDENLLDSDIYVLMKDNSTEEMRGFCCNNEYSRYTDYDGNNKEYISGIYISPDSDEDRYHIYKTIMKFLHEKFPDKGFSIGEYNQMQIKVAKELGFEVVKKTPGHIPYTCGNLLMEIKENNLSGE